MSMICIVFLHFFFFCNVSWFYFESNNFLLGLIIGDEEEGKSILFFKNNSEPGDNIGEVFKFLFKLKIFCANCTLGFFQTCLLDLFFEST